MYQSLASATELDRAFKDSAEQLAQLLASAGVIRHPYADPTLPIYSLLPFDQKRSAYFQLGFYLEALVATAAEGEPISCNATALWSALKKLGMKPPVDFFNYLNEDDCIELYDANHIQVWRNLNMMRVMTHTIEQVFCVPWPNRYHRDEAAMAECVKSALSILSEPKSVVRPLNIKNHVLEKDSTELLNLDVFHRYIATVTDDNHKINGYLVLSSVNVIGSSKFAAVGNQNIVEL